jgi:glutamate-1-semialdehyde aminotransferase
VDFDGNPYPPASDPAFWREIPQDVAAVIIQSIQGQMGRLDPTKPAN